MITSAGSGARRSAPIPRTTRTIPGSRGSVKGRSTCASTSAPTDGMRFQVPERGPMPARVPAGPVALGTAPLQFFAGGVSRFLAGGQGGVGVRAARKGPRSVRSR